MEIFHTCVYSGGAFLPFFMFALPCRYPFTPSFVFVGSCGKEADISHAGIRIYQFLCYLCLGIYVGSQRECQDRRGAVGGQVTLCPSCSYRWSSKSVENTDLKEELKEEISVQSYFRFRFSLFLLWSSGSSNHT